MSTRASSRSISRDGEPAGDQGPRRRHGAVLAEDARDEPVPPAGLRAAAGGQGVPRHARPVRGDPQGGALHQLRLLRLGVQLDGVRSGVPRAGRAREGDALRRRRSRPGHRRAARGVQLRARDLGLHALLLLPGALPEGRRSAGRDRQARRRVDQARDRPRHGRQAREVVRHLREDDGLAARDGARPEDAGDRRLDQGDQVRDEPRPEGQGAAAVPAARRRGREGVARALQPRQGAGPGRRRRHRPGREGRCRASSSPTTQERREQGGRPNDEGRVLQGLPRLALGEGARHLHAGARAEARARAGGARVGHLLRRRRHPRGRAGLLPAPERPDPRLRARRPAPRR